MKICKISGLAFLALSIIFNTASSLKADYFKKGCEFYIKKNYETAKEMFLKDIDIRDNGNAYYFLGEIEKIEKNFEKAQEYYWESTTRNIDKKYLKLAYWNLIIISEQRGRYNEMVSICRELWSRLKDDGAKKKAETLINKCLWTENIEAIELYNNAMDFKKSNMLEETRNALYNSIQYDPSFLAPKFELGVIYYNEDRINDALHYLNEIIDRIPFYGELHLLLGDIYYQRNLYYYSIEHYNKALNLAFLNKNIEYSVRLQRGISNYKLSNYDIALEDLYLATNLKKKAIEPLLIISAINIKNNRYDEALESLKEANSKSPNNPEIIYQIGSIYYKMEDERNIEYFDKLLDISSNSGPVPQKYVNAFIKLAKKYYESGRYYKVAKIIDTIPENVKDYYLTLMAAMTYNELNKPGKAIEYFEKISLSNEEKYILCINYAKKGIDDRAKNLLWELSNIEGFLQRAKYNNSLKKIAYEIEQEQIRILEEERVRREEEEKKRLEEERRRQEEERKRIEDERKRLEEEEKRRIEEKRRQDEARRKEDELQKRLNTKIQDTELEKQSDTKIGEGQKPELQDEISTGKDNTSEINNNENSRPGPEVSKPVDIINTENNKEKIENQEISPSNGP